MTDDIGTPHPLWERALWLLAESHALFEMACRLYELATWQTAEARWWAERERRWHDYDAVFPWEFEDDFDYQEEARRNFEQGLP
jgi:hypothetical protein